MIGLTRNPSNVKVPKGSGGADADAPLTDPNLTVIGGDVTNAADVAKGRSHLDYLFYLSISYMHAGPTSSNSQVDVTLIHHIVQYLRMTSTESWLH